MIVSVIVAYDRQRGIGRAGTLPWHIPADLALFKRVTWGHHIIMGRRTAESIGRALPGRTTLVVTQRSDGLPPGCHAVPTLEGALAHAAAAGETECFVVGGEMLYRAALPFADRIYATEIEGDFECDRFFPPLDETQWEERFAAPVDGATLPARFRILERKGRHLPPPPIATEWASQR